jgi:hypothetical protein
MVGFGAIAMSQEKLAVRRGNRRELNSECDRTISLAWLLFKQYPTN